MQNKSRRLSIILCVCFVLLVIFGTTACGKSEPPIEGVTAADVTCVYDGEYHYLTVENTRDTDVVSYSSNAVYWSEEALGYDRPGEYIIYYKVSRRGCADVVSYAKLTIERTVLTDISADEVEVVHDGKAHGISIDGLLDDDKVTYSIDGTDYNEVALTDVGVYTVYYNVERFYGDYSAACTVTILPNINGNYYNPEYGVISITNKKAVVNGEVKNMSYDLTCSGKIEKTDFRVLDNVLVYDGKLFTKATVS